MNTKAFDDQPQLFGHPVGLYVLFFTELWERFSYYGMRAILVLYIVGKVEDKNPGLGWDDGSALALYGWYTMLVYVASIPGGIIADKITGQKKAVFIGGILLCLGHGILAVETMWAFYSGLGLIIAGVGMLKPNISTMVGGLYADGDERRDKGFTIFYIGINVGAFLSALVVGYVGENIGWHYGFGLAGIGMLVGQLVYMWGQKYLIGVGDLVEVPEDEDQPNLVMDIFKHLNSLLLFGVGIALAVYMFVSGSWDYGLLWVALAFALGVAAVIYNDGTRVEKDRAIVMYVSFLLIIVFWGAFEQAGGLMNLYTKTNTDRNASMLTMHLVFLIPTLYLFGKALYSTLKKDINAKYWYVLASAVGLVYFLLMKYMITSNPFEIPASWFQSLNALFIIALGTAVAGFWYNWKMKGKEASSIFKMALGVIIMGWGFMFMRFASQEFEMTGSSAMYWLVLAYLFHTIGELCASPVALSFITKLAPVKYASFFMGAYFAASGLGNKVAGIVGEGAQEAGELATFTGLVIFCTIVGLLVLAMLKPLKRLTHGAEDLKVESAH